MRQVKKYIANGEHTIDWTYCGKTESRYILIKRNDGEWRSPEHSLAQKLPMKWARSHWFLVRPDGIHLPKGIQPGQRMHLKNNKFELSEMLQFISPAPLP
jgi:hypothetical protein